MNEGKKSLVLYYDIRGPLELLSSEEQGRLFMALLDYAERGELPDFEGGLRIAFAFIRNAIDRDAAAWEDKRKQRRAAGTAGGKRTAEARAATTEANEANASPACENEANEANAVFACEDEANQANAAFACENEANQANAAFACENEANQANAAFACENEANQAVPVPVNVPVNVPVPVPVPVPGPAPVPVPAPAPKQDEESERAAAPRPRARFAPPKVEELRAYAAEKGLDLDAEQFLDYYASKGWLVGKSPMKDWRAAARSWARRERASPKPERGFRRILTDADYEKGWC